MTYIDHKFEPADISSGKNYRTRIVQSAATRFRHRGVTTARAINFQQPRTASLSSTRERRRSYTVCCHRMGQYSRHVPRLSHLRVFC
jgi:hypothetical protein